MLTDTPASSDVTLSIVTTLYNSADFLKTFYERICAQAGRICEQFEIVLVNDGSGDASLEIGLELRKQDARVRIVDLSRNFGQHKAMMTGLAHARGARVFLIDCDLEEEPELLTRFHAEMQRTGADVVYGVQEKRQGSLFKRLSGRLFYKLFEWWSAYPVPSNPMNVRLMSRRYVASLLMHQEREMYMAGLWALTGFKQVGVTAIKHSRGNSSYTLMKRIALVVNALTGFSNRPLYAIFHLGWLIMAVSSVAIVMLIVQRLLSSEYQSGWASLIVSVWFLGGLIIFCQGIMSIYLSKIFIETKQRPYTVVRAVYGEKRDCTEPGMSASCLRQQTPSLEVGREYPVWTFRKERHQ